ncbi:MAG TPA: phosphate ABC transporter permease PstA [Tepidisphaeraceae bacterium]|nr:phosphate ABC transporter permease PstA [Tepidisphaeraceae bacterium]
MRGPLHDTISRATSHAMYTICIVFTVFILTVLALVTGYLVYLGFSSISLSFSTEDPTGNPASPGGMRNALIGTGILVGLASLIGVPMGILTGVYLSEYDADSWLAGPVRFVCDVLAGVPSIVVGILGYELLVVPMGRFNGWAGALALAFIMVPIIARTTEEMLRLVPNSYREASLGTGASKARTIFTVVLPAAMGSTITGIMLAIARVAGETAPLLFTALGSRYLTTNPNEPFPSLTVQIYKYATGPSPEEKRLAWAGILILISLIFVLNLSVRIISRKMHTKAE